jgi:chromosome partitioning protein
MAADHILIPIIPTTLSQLTYAKLIEFLEESRYDRKKVVPFFSMVDGRKKLHMETMEKMARDDPGILKNYIPHISEIEKMGIEREPVTSSHRKSRGSRAFEVLWDEIKSRLMIHKGN